MSSSSKSLLTSFTSSLTTFLVSSFRTFTPHSTKCISTPLSLSSTTAMYEHNSSIYNDYYSPRFLITLTMEASDNDMNASCESQENKANAKV